MRTQVTFDAADPHALAAFWASVLSTEVEDHSGFVDQLVADGRMPAEDRITINGRSAFRDVAACRDPHGVEPGSTFRGSPRATSSACTDAKCGAIAAPQLSEGAQARPVERRDVICRRVALNLGRVGRLHLGRESDPGALAPADPA